MTKPTKWQVRPAKFRTTVKPVQLQDPQAFALNEMQKNSLSGVKILKIEPQHDKTKWLVRPAKTQISLGIRTD